jgi:hypothetical protein
VQTEEQTGLYQDGSVLKCSGDGTAQIVSGKASNESEPGSTQPLDGCKRDISGSSVRDRP